MFYFIIGLFPISLNTETLQKILVDTIEPKENVLESQENQKKVEVQEANGKTD